MITSIYPQLPEGRLEWKVEGVKQKIRNRQRYYSDPFFVGLYKCQGRIEWDFANTGDVRVRINIMKGDFDDKLHERTVVLTDQINSKDDLVKSFEITKYWLERSSDGFKRPTGIRNEGFGLSFVSNTEILKEKYCKQDSITLHISVEVLPSL